MRPASTELSPTDLAELLPQIASTRAGQAAALGIGARALDLYLTGRQHIPIPVARLAVELAKRSDTRLHDFNALLPRIGENRAQQAEALGVDYNTLVHYAGGSRNLPLSVERLAHLLAAG